MAVEAGIPVYEAWELTVGEVALQIEGYNRRLKKQRRLSAENAAWVLSAWAKQCSVDKLLPNDDSHLLPNQIRAAAEREAAVPAIRKVMNFLKEERPIRHTPKK